MLIKFFNYLYSTVLSNKYLKWMYYALLFTYPWLFLFFYQKYGLLAIGFHTNLILPLYFIAIFDFLGSTQLLRQSIVNRVKHIASIYLIIEFFLIVVRPPTIYIPFVWGQYFSPYETQNASFYHTASPHQTYNLKSSEFNFQRTSNSLGFSDAEWNKEKNDSTVRILCLGDSFTEGDGAAYDSTYVSFLKRSLQQRNQHIEVLNGGFRGSDPFFNFKYLKDVLIEYQPDIILQSFTTNDLYYDILIRGGIERFQEDGTLRFRKNYLWEPIYAMSFISRIFIQVGGGFDKYLIKRSEYTKFKEDATTKTIQLFQDYQTFTEDHQIELIPFTMPFNQGIDKSQENTVFYQKFKKEFAHFDLKFYNLQDCYARTTQNDNAIYKKYFWEKDGHHNAQGYKMMASCIEEILMQQSKILEAFIHKIEE